MREAILGPGRAVTARNARTRLGGRDVPGIPAAERSGRGVPVSAGDIRAVEPFDRGSMTDKARDRYAKRESFAGLVQDRTYQPTKEVAKESNPPKGGSGLMPPRTETSRPSSTADGQTRPDRSRISDPMTETLLGSSVAPNQRPDGSDDPVGRQKNRRVEIVATQGAGTRRN